MTSHTSHQRLHWSMSMNMDTWTTTGSGRRRWFLISSDQVVRGLVAHGRCMGVRRSAGRRRRTAIGRYTRQRHRRAIGDTRGDGRLHAARARHGIGSVNRFPVYFSRISPSQVSQLNPFAVATINQIPPLPPRRNDYVHVDSLGRRVCPGIPGIPCRSAAELRIAWNTRSVMQVGFSVDWTNIFLLVHTEQILVS